jgi:hypothetical protein
VHAFIASGAKGVVNSRRKSACKRIRTAGANSPLWPRLRVRGSSAKRPSGRCVGCSSWQAAVVPVVPDARLGCRTRTRASWTALNLMGVHHGIQSQRPSREPWNEGKIVGPRLHSRSRTSGRYECAFKSKPACASLPCSMGIDSKLRGCDLVGLKFGRSATATKWQLAPSKA